MSCNAGFSNGEVNVLLNIAVNCTPLPVPPINILTATTVLNVYWPNGSTQTTLAMTPDPTGLYAQRLTLATDFPMPGEYELILVSTFPDGTVLKSLPFVLTVGGFV